MQNIQVSQQMLLLKFREGTPIKGSRGFAPTVFKLRSRGFAPTGFKGGCSHRIQGGLLPQCSRGVAPTELQGGFAPTALQRGLLPQSYKGVCSHSVQGGLFVKAKRFCVMSVNYMYLVASFPVHSQILFCSCMWRKLKFSPQLWGGESLGVA